jgi:hypothetical protein
LAGIALFCLLIRSLPPQCYSKDIQAVYLSALALRDGIDLFTPMHHLSGRYFPEAIPISPLPNHLPPILSLFCLPLTILPFASFSILWLALNSAALVAAGRRLGLSGPGCCALFAWPPAFWLLDNGNLDILVLLFLAFGWEAARRGLEWRAGSWLGLAAVLKFYPALLVLPYALRGRSRIVISAFLVFAAGQAGNLIAAGYEGLLLYFREILPSASSLWIHLGLNSAPYGALGRLFGGAEDVGPLVEAPWLVLPVTLLLSLFAISALPKLTPEKAPLVLLAALPNVRGYMAILALPAIIQLWRADRERWSTIILAMAASFVLPIANLTVSALKMALGTARNLSSLASVLTSFQSAGGIGLLFLSIKKRNAKSVER